MMRPGSATSARTATPTSTSEAAGAVAGQQLMAANPPASDAGAQRAAPVADADDDAGTSPVAPPKAALPKLSAAELVGVLAGPGCQTPDGLQFFGTDLGWTFEHHGALTILFGDTMPTARFYCDTPQPMQDDTLGRLPSSLGDAVPAIDFVTLPSQPQQLATIQVNRAGAPLDMGIGKTPLTGFSDGNAAFAIMGHVEFTTCPAGATDFCDERAALSCVHDLGLCQPSVGDAVIGCDPNNSACGLGQECKAPETGYCVDLTSSQYDGTRASLPYAIARSAEIAQQRDDDPAVFDSVYTFVSKKFHNPVARSIARLGKHVADYDYAPGYGGLLIWGRPAYFAEQGRQGQLYLLRHALPLPVHDGALAFAPEFFAGVDAVSGEPLWSSEQRDASAIAMDGKQNGDPSETLVVLDQMSINWLGPPIDKWIMLYGGDIPDVLLIDAAGAQATRGPLRVRYADAPWGPWSPAQDYLSPGSPDHVGDPYGPGGFLYHYDCRDQPDHPCAKSDPVRPVDALLPGCQTPALQLDIGRIYAPNIVDAYTRQSATGLDITWNISTWNPYAVLLMRSHIEP